MVRLTWTHDGFLDNNKFEPKKNILYIWLSFKSLYNSVNIYDVIITGPEEPVEKKMVLELRAREKYFQKYTS